MSARIRIARKAARDAAGGLLPGEKRVDALADLDRRVDACVQIVRGAHARLELEEIQSDRLEGRNDLGKPVADRRTRRSKIFDGAPEEVIEVGRTFAAAGTSLARRRRLGPRTQVLRGDARRRFFPPGIDSATGRST